MENDILGETLDSTESGNPKKILSKRMTYYFVKDVWEQPNDDSIREDIWYYIVETFEVILKRIMLKKKTSLYYVSRRIAVFQQNGSKIYYTFTVKYLISRPLF